MDVLYRKENISMMKDIAELTKNMKALREKTIRRRMNLKVV